MRNLLAIIIGLVLLLLINGELYQSPKIVRHQPAMKAIEAVVTAYCPCKKCCGKWADGHTACNHRIIKGEKFVSAPPEYPFGTMLQIPGYSTEPVPVLDRGGAIKGNKFDVFFYDHNEALKWGRRKMKIYMEQE